MSPEEALADLRGRADRAAQELRRQAGQKTDDARIRLCAKATGVELVRSYIDDAISLSSRSGGSV